MSKPSSITPESLPGISGDIWRMKYRFSGSPEVAADKSVTDSWRRVARALATAETDRPTLAPFFVSGGGYRSNLNLLNGSQDPWFIRVEARAGDGSVIGEILRQTLGPGEALRGDVLSLFGVQTIQTFPTIL